MALCYLNWELFALEERVRMLERRILNDTQNRLEIALDNDFSKCGVG